MKSRPVFVSGLLVAGCLFGVSATEAAPAPARDGKTPGPTYLFVVNSRAGRIAGVGKDTGKERLTVTFRGVADHATQFSDRPFRKAYVLSTRDLVSRWRGWFRGDPPNAVLSFVYPGRDRDRPHSIVLELTRPRYRAKANTLTFSAVHLHRQADLSPQAKQRVELPKRRPPRRFNHGSLFIDSVPDEQTTTCVPKPEASCPDADLSGVDWSGKDLSYAELNGVNLRGADLRGATFRFADMSDVDLTGANLTNTTFADAHMRRATVTDATLQSTDFSRATLLNALLPKADLSAEKKIRMNGAVLNRALLTDARLVGTDLSTTRLKGARLAGADLTGANLSAALLDNADLHGATLDRADLSQASAVGAELQKASMVGINGSSVNLSKADMGQATLTGANLYSANLPDANLSAATLRNVSAPRAKLPRANLFAADMTGMNLEHATIEGSDLRGQTTWFKATMPHYQMDNLNLAGTDFRDFYPPASYTSLHLNGSNLSRTNWRGWDRTVLGLGQTNLTDADLRDINPPPYSFFVEAKMTRTKLSGSTFKLAWFTKAEIRDADARNVQWDSGYLAGTRFIDTDLTGSTWVNKAGPFGGSGPEYNPVFEGSTICPDGGPIPCASLMF